MYHTHLSNCLPLKCTWGATASSLGAFLAYRDSRMGHLCLCIDTIQPIQSGSKPPQDNSGRWGVVSGTRARAIARSDTFLKKSRNANVLVKNETMASCKINDVPQMLCSLVCLSNALVPTSELIRSWSSLVVFIFVGVGMTDAQRSGCLPWMLLHWLAVPLILSYLAIPSILTYLCWIACCICAVVLVFENLSSFLSLFVVLVHLLL